MRPDAAGISLAEDQIEHVQNCGQASSPLLRRRETKWCARSLNGLLRAADSLRHRGLGNQKGIGDFSRGQTANRSQRQCDCGGRRERGMAAHEQQNQSVVWIHVGLDFGERCQAFRFRGHRRFSFAAGNFAAHMVHHAAARHLNQPAPGIFRNTLLRPLGKSSDHGFLHRILSRGEILEAASNSAEHLRRKFTQQVLGIRVPFLGHRSSRYSISGGGPLMTWRTSIGIFNGTPPGPGAADALAAISYARCGLSTSIIQNPARNSLDSGKTPSVMGRPSLPACTSFAWSGNDSPSADTSSPRSCNSLLKPIIKAMCACRSFLGQPGTPWPAFIVFIIKMYFISSPIEFVGTVFSPSSLRLLYRELDSWVANCRTSIGMFTDAAEIRPAMA